MLEINENGLYFQTYLTENKDNIEAVMNTSQYYTIRLDIESFININRMLQIDRSVFMRFNIELIELNGMRKDHESSFFLSLDDKTKCKVNSVTFQEILNKLKLSRNLNTNFNNNQNKKECIIMSLSNPSDFRFEEKLFNSEFIYMNIRESKNPLNSRDRTLTIYSNSKQNSKEIGEEIFIEQRVNIFYGLIESNTKEIKKSKITNQMNLDITSVFVSELPSNYMNSSFNNIKMQQKKSFLTNAEREQGNNSQNNILITQNNNRPILITNDIKSVKTKIETFQVKTIMILNLICFRTNPIQFKTLIHIRLII